MFRRSAVAALIPVTQDDDPNALVSERFERRLGEETGKLRVEMVDGFGKLRTEIGELRAEMRGEFGNVRAEMRGELGNVRAEMREGFGNLRAETAHLRAEMIGRNADLLKWLLVFFVTQIAAVAALLKLLR